jgi:hypothetical protein
MWIKRDQRIKFSDQSWRMTIDEHQGSQTSFKVVPEQWKPDAESRCSTGLAWINAVICRRGEHTLYRFGSVPFEWNKYIREFMVDPFATITAHSANDQFLLRAIILFKNSRSASNHTERRTTTGTVRCLTAPYVKVLSVSVLRSRRNEDTITMSFEDRGIPGTVVGHVTIKGIPFFSP